MKDRVFDVRKGLDGLVDVVVRSDEVRRGKHLPNLWIGCLTVGEARDLCYKIVEAIK